MDTIGIPVYTSTRPPGKVITISAGKGMEKFQAKAGAILEAVELWAAENPGSALRWIECSVRNAGDFSTRALDPTLFTLAADAPLNDDSFICYDEMDDLVRGDAIFVPSDMVWLEPRIRTPFQYFQGTSNGLSAGLNRQDAELGALYELVERDGWGISDFIRDRAGAWPPRVGLECPLPDLISDLADKLSNAGVRPFIFDLRTDLSIPIFGCTLIDPGDFSPGAFAGYGCSLDSEIALRRAITEAAQARCAYISGARDDLFRRRFVLMKKMDSAKLLRLYEQIRVSSSFSDHPCPHYETVSQEWEALTSRLTERGISEMYSKLLYQCQADDQVPQFCVVRMVTPQLEPPVWEHWTPGKRALAALDTFSRRGLSPA